MMSSGSAQKKEAQKNDEKGRNPEMNEAD